MDIKKIIANYKDIFYYKTLEKHLVNSSSVLDVGCGDDSPIQRVNKTFYSIGIDAFKPSILKSKRKNIHNDYKIGVITNLKKYFKPKSFDTVIALDVIEHFEKKDAFELIKNMEKIARKKVILLTPNGFYPQDTFNDNPFQVHKSGWSKRELKNLGYRVYGLRGIKYLRGDFATIKYKPWVLWGFIAFFSEPLLHYFPNFSYDLFAVKKLE